MKLSILSAVLCAACVSAVGQGALNFANYVPGAGINAPIRDLSIFGGGALLAGNAYGVDLYWGPAGTTDSNALTALNQPASFLTGAGAGYFLGGARTIPGVAGGTTITVQVRAWDTADGASWAAVVSSGSLTARVGQSSLFNVTLTVPPQVPSNLVGLQPFTIGIPEPSAMALAGLGATALLIFRRQWR